MQSAAYGSHASDRRAGGGGPGGGGPPALYRDEEDRRALEQMNEFDREAELARRYEEKIRERQRRELIKKTEAKHPRKVRRVTSRGANDDSRRGSEAMSESSSSSGDGSSSSSSGGSSSDDSSANEDEEASPASAGADTAQTPQRRLRRAAQKESTPSPLSSIDDAIPSSHPPSPPPTAYGTGGAASSSSTFAAPEGGAAARGGRLFDAAEERLTATSSTKDRVQPKFQKATEKVSPDLMNAVRLSNSQLVHMLEHPRVKDYVTGCFVKVPAPSSSRSSTSAGDANAAPAPCWLCMVVDLRPCVPYSVSVSRRRGADGDGSGGFTTSTIYRELVLRVAPTTPARFDRAFKLTNLRDAPVDATELQLWKDKMINADVQEDLYKQLKHKRAKLRQFTFTDDDVARILERKAQAAGAGGGDSGPASGDAAVEGGAGGRPSLPAGTILKALMTVKHDIETLNSSLASASTEIEKRQQNRKKLQALQKQREALETQLKKEKAPTMRSLPRRDLPLHSHGVGSSAGALRRAGGPSSAWGGGSSTVSSAFASFGSPVTGTRAAMGRSPRRIALGGARPVHLLAVPPKDSAGGANLTARRECRPTLMWDVSDTPSPTAATAGRQAQAAEATAVPENSTGQDLPKDQTQQAQKTEAATFQGKAAPSG
eukprot:GHVT01091213.1.p1 GENE.GHVT01091213.1~~GHVT01091213.1.p1  ORF type:complete len:658 (-),score=161.25 GHVT01091213.1:298-2271(-)